MHFDHEDISFRYVRQPNRTKFALLAFLGISPMSGYDMRRNIDRSISNFWSESYGRIYPMLAQLEAEGLATRTETETEGGRPRNVYKITKAGREALRQWFEEPIVERPPRHELLLRVFFGTQADASLTHEALEQFRERQLARLERYAEIREDIDGLKGRSDSQPFWSATLRFGEIEAQAHLAWAEETLENLGRPTPASQKKGSVP